MNRPLVLLVIALIIGIIGASVFNINVTITLSLAGVAWLTAGIGLIRAWRYNAWVLFCACITVGLVLTAVQMAAVKSPVTALNGKSVRVVGEVVNRPDVRPDGVFYKLELSKVTYNSKTKAVQGFLRAKVMGDRPVFKYGDILELPGFLTVPEPPGNPGAFDYREWLTRQGIAATLTVKDAREVKILGRSGNPVVRIALTARDNLEQIFDATMSKTKAAVLKGIMFGTRGEIPQQVQLAFNQTGLVHILSVSGYHVGLVAGLILALLRLFRLPGQYTAWVAIPALLFYAVMTGLGPAVFRSTLMAILLLLAHHLGRQQDWPTTLASAAGVLLVLNPLNLYDIGFQLSFVATWGLLYLTPMLITLFHRIPKTIGILLMVPLAAQLATLPLVVLYFNLVSPVSILANLVTTHLVALIMLFGGVSLFLGLIYLPLAGFINVSTGLLTTLFLWLVQFCAFLPGAAWYIPAPPLWSVVVYYLLLVVVFECLYHPEKKVKIREVLLKVVPQSSVMRLSIASLAFTLVTVIWLMCPLSNQLELHFIDVGQGDSALIITPNERTMLIDAGGWKDELLTGRGAGDYVIVPYLHRLGINSLDVLVLTHPHSDHAGGARAVINSMPVKMVVVSPYGLEKGDKVDDGYESLIKQIKNQGIQIHTARAGDRLKIDPDITINMLSPAERYTGTRSDANNNSLVIKLNYRQRTALFTGDMEIESEEDLTQRGEVTQTEILKVPHHGSGYFYQDFFSQVNPRISVISVGANNRFGHPAPKTLEALKDTKCKIYRTDQQGAVILTTDGSGWNIRTGK